MRKHIFSGLVLPLSLVLVLFLIGCEKKDLPAETGTVAFISLTVERDTLPIMELTKVIAKATGENLTYKWTCDNELGIFEGSGSEIIFTICHGGKFKITCEIEDNAGNKASKDVYVNYVE